MKAKPIPDGYHSLTPYLIVDGAKEALDFYHAVFGARELYRLDAPGGRIGHAEMLIGDSPFMLADEHPEMGYKAPGTYGGTPVSILVYVEDADAVFERAVAAGSRVQRPVKDQFYGDRCGTIVDPFGHVWTISTHVEDLTPDEIGRRAAEEMGKM